MTLLLKFGGFDNYEKRETVSWDKDYKDFPIYAKYDNKFWACVFYDNAPTPDADCTLHFSQHRETALPIDMYGNQFPVTDLGLMFNFGGTQLGKVCECGSEKFGGGRHSDYCPKYEKT